jgi:hypothetical protein
MRCMSCQSLNTSVYPAELNIHHPGMEGLDKPTVWAFPHLLVCRDCGVTQFSLSSNQLRELSEPDSSRSEAAAA